MNGDRVLSFLTTLADAVPNAQQVFTEGCCFRLFLILRHQWPEARAYYVSVEGHVYTQIGKWLYDIRGRWSRDHLPPGFWLDTERRLFLSAHRWHWLGRDKPKGTMLMTATHNHRPPTLRAMKRSMLEQQVGKFDTVDQCLEAALEAEQTKRDCGPFDPAFTYFATRQQRLENLALLMEQLDGPDKEAAIGPQAETVARAGGAG